MIGRVSNKDEPSVDLVEDGDACLLARVWLRERAWDPRRVIPPDDHYWSEWEMQQYFSNLFHKSEPEFTKAVPLRNGTAVLFFEGYAGSPFSRMGKLALEREGLVRWSGFAAEMTLAAISLPEAWKRITDHKFSLQEEGRAKPKPKCPLQVPTPSPERASPGSWSDSESDTEDLPTPPNEKPCTAEDPSPWGDERYLEEQMHHAQQGATESTESFALRLLDMARTLSKRFPQDFPWEAAFAICSRRFGLGLRPEIRRSIQLELNRPYTNFFKVRRAALKAEERLKKDVQGVPHDWLLGEGDASDDPVESKAKPWETKAYLEIQLTEAQQSDLESTEAFAVRLLDMARTLSGRFPSEYPWERVYGICTRRFHRGLRPELQRAISHEVRKPDTNFPRLRHAALIAEKDLDRQTRDGPQETTGKHSLDKEDSVEPQSDYCQVQLCITDFPQPRCTALFDFKVPTKDEVDPEVKDAFIFRHPNKPTPLTTRQVKDILRQRRPPQDSAEYQPTDYFIVATVRRHPDTDSEEDEEPDEKSEPHSLGPWGEEGKRMSVKPEWWEQPVTRKVVLDFPGKGKQYAWTSTSTPTGTQPQKGVEDGMDTSSTTIKVQVAQTNDDLAEGDEGRPPSPAPDRAVSR